MESYQTTGTHFWIEEGILFTDYQKEYPLTIEIAKEFIEARSKIFGATTYPMLVDIRGLKSMESGVREFIFKDEGFKFISACGIIIESDVSKFMGSAIICVNKPIIPIKLFTNKDFAREWLVRYK